MLVRGAGTSRPGSVVLREQLGSVVLREQLLRGEGGGELVGLGNPTFTKVVTREI